MVAVPFVLVLALMSSTAVVARPKINGHTGLVAYFKQKITPKSYGISTKSVYEWIPPSESASAPTCDRNSVKIGLSHILKKLRLKSNEFKVKTSFTDRSGTTHLYGVPLYLGFPIGNLHAAVHVKNGHVLFYSATIIDDKESTKGTSSIPESTAEKSSEEAVKAAVDCLKVPFYHDTAPVKELYVLDDGGYSTSVVVSKEDFKWGFTYKAIELPDKNPRDGVSEIVDPENLQTSPNGWTEGYRLKGNNVEAKSKRCKTLKTTTKGMFDVELNHISPPQTPKSTAIGVINAFYVANMVHDVLYLYGFNEQAGNFQLDNFGKGGRGGDQIIINVQDSKEANNAYFSTPPDGQPGVLDLHIFTATNPHRDSALDNTIIVHELAHGLSGRLTGGAWTNMCMAETESKGLSEGYSDIAALIFTAKPEDTRNTKKVIGEYVKGDPRGSRKYPYTTDMDVNHLVYQDAVGEEQRHALGEIWAVMLLEVYWNLVDKYGFSANLHDATQNKGNIIFLQLLVGTLMIQPCNPTFESARVAMLAADDAYYGGIHKHLIRQGFAKRGLGSIS
ncbi:hypothetical protein BASA62_010242 [Batrachochytrium salamandrivorans]|nr:hypothetical protein BASA62_010242 [Batrachochytrium salamandrivorans]